MHHKGKCSKCGEETYWIRYKDIYWCPDCELEFENDNLDKLKHSANSHLCDTTNNIMYISDGKDWITIDEWKKLSNQEWDERIRKVREKMNEDAAYDIIGMWIEEEKDKGGD